MVNEGIIRDRQYLFGFPRPSGANGHRKRQFDCNKEFFIILISLKINKKATMEIKQTLTAI